MIRHSSKEMDRNSVPSIPEGDFDMVLLADYSLYRRKSLMLMESLFSELDKYGTFSESPPVALFSFYVSFLLLSAHFTQLRTWLVFSIESLNRRMSEVSAEYGSESFFYELYAKKWRRTLSKIEYLNYVNEITEYIRHFISTKAR